MKAFAAGLTAAYASEVTSLCACLRVLASNGFVYTFTATDKNVIVGGETYLSAPGFGISNLVSQAGLAVDNMEVTVLPDETDYPQVDILAGRWDNAKFWIFECDYLDSGIAGGSPVGSGVRTDINLLKRGRTGNAETLRSTNKFEFRSMKQALQQMVGAVTSKTCRYRFGSTSHATGGFCMIDIALWTETYLVTSVDPGSPRRIFTCSAATEADDHYGDGKATATDSNSPNTDYSQKIKTFAAGVFTLAREMPFEIMVGDEFTFEAGCRKRLEEDCRDKYDNVLNFGGEPHVPGQDLLTADPEIDVS